MQNYIKFSQIKIIKYLCSPKQIIYSKMRRTTHYFLLSALATLCSCSVSKFIPEGEHLLDEVSVVSESNDVKAGNLHGYVRQNPNASWFSTFKVPLHIYSMSGLDSTKWRNRTLRKLGEAPVIYDAELAERSANDLRIVMQNMGYMGASVDVDTTTNKHKIKVKYLLKPGELYYVRNLNFNIPDTAVARVLRNDSANSLLRPGMVFSINTLEQERSRAATHLQNSGYYHFNKEFISFTADTCSGSKMVDLTLNLKLYKQTNSSEPTMHRKYTVNSVNILADIDNARPRRIDTIKYNGYNVLYEKGRLRYRPKVLTRHTHIRPQYPYRERAVQSTYTSMGRLQYLKYTTINFRENSADSTLLDCYINLTHGRSKSFSFEVEGTNSAGDLGAASAVTFQHRNLFKGSELLQIRVRGAYEAISGLEGYSDNNYTELGAEASIRFPSFLCPFLKNDFRRRVNATSELSLQYNTQNRPEFKRRVATAVWRYRWNQYRRKAQHKVDVLDLNYVYMPWISEKFKHDYIDSLGNQNAILKYNYENLLITKAGYTYNYNSLGMANSNASYGTNAYNIRFNVESSGNLLYAVTSTFKTAKNEHGQYKVGNIAYAQFLKGDFDFSKGFVIDKKNSVAVHIGFGIAYPYGNSTVLPFEKRYFSGGANSVRGWSVRTLGPGSYAGRDKTINFINQSGDVKLDMNIEYRTFLFWKVNGAVFIDAGNIWTVRQYDDQPGGEFRLNKFYKQIAASYGLGLRFNFDYFIVRFDGGVKAVDPRDGYKRFPIAHPNLSRDFAFHFAVGLPF